MFAYNSLHAIHDISPTKLAPVLASTHKSYVRKNISLATSLIMHVDNLLAYM